jgi:hypothetical protein
MNGKGNSLQEKMDIVEIKEDVVVMKDGSLRAVLATTAINMDLKSEEEQQAIIYNFQQFLTTFDFSFQIVVSSRQFNINPYVNQLKKRIKLEENVLLKNQIKDYVDFIEELIGLSNVMSKMFYIVVPFYVVEVKNQGIFKKIFSVANKKKALYQNHESFETYKNQLFQRAEQIKSSLSSMGLSGAMLQTEELIELYYNAYNPSEFEYVDLENISSLDLEK